MNQPSYILYPYGVLLFAVYFVVSHIMSKEAQIRAAINQKLIEMGERERLKELLRAKLVECGWKDQLKAHCKDTV
uniref:ENY2 transcription and export complex 2 subunit n=1 Tax=Takifugu rubripes TaxID=31033 RepID=A0A674PRU2_TAKRU